MRGECPFPRPHGVSGQGDEEAQVSGGPGPRSVHTQASTHLHGSPGMTLMAGATPLRLTEHFISDQVARDTWSGSGSEVRGSGGPKKQRTFRTTLGEPGRGGGGRKGHLRRVGVFVGPGAPLLPPPQDGCRLGPPPGKQGTVEETGEEPGEPLRYRPGAEAASAQTGRNPRSGGPQGRRCRRPHRTEEKLQGRGCSRRLRATQAWVSVVTAAGMQGC